MQVKIGLKVSCLVMALSISGCMSGAQHSSRLHSAQERRMTVGIVQREIHKGMPQADVAVALGSPNIVTRDATGTETWIYDKIATEASYSFDSGSVSGGLGAGGMPGKTSLVLGGLGGGYKGSAGAASMSQRTLTVVIKFDENGVVKDFTYHSSRF